MFSSCGLRSSCAGISPKSSKSFKSDTRQRSCTLLMLGSFFFKLLISVSKTVLISYICGEGCELLFSEMVGAGICAPSTPALVWTVEEEL